MTARPITEADVSASYEVGALLEVARAALGDLEQGPVREVQQLAGSLETTMRTIIQKWGEVHDALELAQWGSKGDPEQKAVEAKPCKGAEVAS